MSFNNKNFSVMSYANGFTLWNYTTEDTLQTVKGEGYFDETAPFARKGDMILVVADKAAAIESTILFVKSISDKNVTVADIIPEAAVQSAA